MGEGGRRHLWGGRPATAPSQSTRASAPGTRRPPQEPESLGAQSPEPASERLSALGSLPSPSRAAQPEPVPGRGRRGGVPRPAGFSDPAGPRRGRGGRGFCCPPQLRGPGAAWAEVWRASPIRPGASSSRPPGPRLSARGSDTRARDAQPARPRRSSCLGRPAASAAPEPGPAPPGRVRRGWGPTAPPPQHPTEQWGRGQSPLLPSGRQARSWGRGWGASPPLMH